ncbi:MAG: RecQ family ATP-dependent DNA helicase, partial [Lewinella sp.]|nr:RecQ family ATP-dependent DNA helicase [Lewinella sp.]
IQFIRQRPDQSGIIYCLSRKSTEKLAADLNTIGVKAKAYHAGLPAETRASVQEDFIKDDVPVICATIAFGMGIEKSNVRWVIHYNLPKNLENYYQEIGRAGRDGAPADTLLFYSYQDVMFLRDIISKNENPEAGEHADVQLAKLERMQQYAESVACRRRILLNYFNENLDENCGNCDICRNPPKAFDGTEIAQKALSAVYRLREQAGMGTVIDVLRGSGKAELQEKGYDQIKTFGAGRDLSFADWQTFLYQLLNLGYIDIAHEERGAVKLTPASEKVLFEDKKVELVRLATLKERRERAKEQAKQKTRGDRVRDELFERLRVLRRQLAQQKGVPPYIIFSDATLEEMAAAKPVTDEQMSAISGVGERKLHLYGTTFMDEILEYLGQKGNAPQGSSQRISYELYRQGKDIPEIAEQRQMTEQTIWGHLITAFQAGETLDIHDFVSAEHLDYIGNALPYLEKPVRLKALFEYFDENIPYEVLRMAMAYLKKEGKV